MNNLFSILLFSIILLNGNCTVCATTASPALEQGASLFVKGFEIANECLKRLSRATTLLQNPTDTTSEAEPVSSETLTRDLNVYTKIRELGVELSEASTERKEGIFDHLAILTYSHFLTPGTIIDQKTKEDLFNKLGSGRSDSANYFIQCLFYNERTAHFFLTQDRLLNAAINTYVSLAHEISPLLKNGSVLNGKELCTNYIRVDNLISVFATKSAPYQWTFDGSANSFTTLFGIFSELKSDLLPLSQELYQINTKAKKAMDDRTDINRLLSSIYFKRFEDVLSKLKAEHLNEVTDLTEEKIIRLIAARVKLYKNSVKELKENQKSNTIIDPNYSHFVNALGDRIEVYALAKDILLRSRALEAEKKKASRNRLYILLSVHMQCIKLEESTEGFYVEPIIDFLVNSADSELSISSEARIFADILAVKQENSETKYDIEFNDDLHARWMRQRNKFMSMENGHLLINAGEIFNAITDLVDTYKRFTESFKALLGDQQSLFPLFETFKPLITQYKKEVTRKVSAFENLINKETPSSGKKKKKKKNNIIGDNSLSNDASIQVLSIENVDQIPGDKDKTTDSSDSTFDIGTTDKEKINGPIVVEVIQTSQQPLTSVQRKKMRKEANRLKRAEADDASKQISEEAKAEELAETEALVAIPAEQNRSTKERKQTLRATIAKQKEREKQAKLIEKKQVEHKKTNQFTFNPLAAEFKPILPDAMKQQNGQHESSYTDEKASAQSSNYGKQTYNPDHAAWLAKQHAWQKHYASLGYPAYEYPMVAYGYPIQQQYLLGGLEPRSHF